MKTDNHLFLQKLRVLSLRRIAGVLDEQDILSDSSLLTTLYNHSISFFTVYLPYYNHIDIILSIILSVYYPSSRKANPFS